MVNALTVIVNITNCHCEACFAATLVTFQLTKKAFRSSLLWKAFNTRNIAFSGQLELLLNNYDNRNV